MRSSNVIGPGRCGPADDTRPSQSSAFPISPGKAGADARFDSVGPNVTTTILRFSRSPAYTSGVPRALCATTFRSASLYARAFSIESVNGSTPLTTGWEPAAFHAGRSSSLVVSIGGANDSEG